MGDGDPTVLPLYHACAFETGSGEVARSHSGKTGGGGGWAATAVARANDHCREAVSRTINETGVAAGCGPLPKGARGSSGSRRGSNDGGGGLMGDGIREQPASLWHLSDRLAGRAESFIMEHAVGAPGRGASGAVVVPATAPAPEAAAPGPFFLYFPLVHTHTPHTPAARFVAAAAAAVDAHAGLGASGASEEVSSLYRADARWQCAAVRTRWGKGGGGAAGTREQTRLWWFIGAKGPFSHGLRI